MKLKKYIKVLSYFIIFTLLVGINAGASMPDVVKIITQKGILYTVQYENYDLNVERIKIEGSNDIVYCLEIDKKYPSGQNFLINGTNNEKINNIIAAGYPNRSVAQLNLDNENEAYSATQIAIWSSVQGYDVNKIKGDNPKILAAIRNIYNDGVSGKYKNILQSKIYKTSDESVQEVIIIPNVDLMAEEKAESEQIEYAPQEG
ncbi:MAG: thioester domain-containing protein [Clostridium sp.]|uniref:thioester domain-containing protein n=1 Tax=Clostridium sp. TaxID=1506 RepID=UPI0025C48790|nr:thioester domain-containing protein [Clostridium sp.]MCE5222104.1 thioester domain-containing protein [Clostridium sp.]